MFKFTALFLLFLSICIEFSLSSVVDRLSSLPSRQHFTCSAACYAVGNCNEELQQCECPLGRSGENCERDHLSACRSSASPNSIAFIGHWTIKNCDCWSQLAGVENMTMPALKEDARRIFLFRSSFEHDKNGQIKCFRSTNGPQISDIPPHNDTKIEWFQGLGRLARRIPFPTEIDLDSWVSQLPLSMCPDRCNEKGACVMRGPRSSPQCMCTRGFTGPSCKDPNLHGCPNRCGGNGACNEGFCHCKRGSWGTDCTRDKAFTSSPSTPPSTLLKIYRFELTWQAAFFHETDDLHTDYDQIYSAWEHFYNQFSLDTVTRTQNIAEANLFYIPAFLYFKTSNLGTASPFLRHVLQFLRSTYPSVWGRHQGKDHFVFLTQDRGPCSLPNGPNVNNLIKIVHFGMEAPEPWALHAIHDLDLPDAAASTSHRQLQVASSSIKSRSKISSGIDKSTYSCYLPARDIVAPDHWIDGNKDVTKAPAVYSQALSLVGAPRPYLLFFGGGIRPNDREYSGGVRLALSRFVLEKNYSEVKNGGDSSFYAQSTFCICPYGHGWGSRLTHSMVGACIPVIIQDHVHAILEDVLDYPSFSIRLAKSDIPQLMTILRGISATQIQDYRLAMSRVWRKFSWHEGGEAFGATLTALRRKLYNLKAYHYM